MPCFSRKRSAAPSTTTRGRGTLPPPWLTQGLLAELYHTTKQNISQHIQNIYEEGERVPEATVKKYLTVRQVKSLGWFKFGEAKGGV